MVAIERVFSFPTERSAKGFEAEMSGRFRGSSQGYCVRRGRFVEVGDLYEAEVADVEAEAARHGGEVRARDDGAPRRRR